MLRFAPAAALFWLAASPVLHAQIAPDALWSAWQNGSGAVTATGTATPDGDALVVESPRITIGALVLQAGSLRLTPDGDATLIDLPDTFSMGQGSIAADIHAPDLILRATGDSADPTYTLTANQMDAALSGDTLTADLLASGVDATIGPTATEAQIGLLSLASETAGFAASRSGVDLRIDGPLDALTSLAAGETGDDVTITLNATGTTQDTTLANDRGTVRVSTGASEETAQATSGTVSLTQKVSDVSVALDTPALPLAAATLRIAQAASTLTGPIAIGAEPAPTSFNLDVTGLTAAEELWQLFDPAGTLPRDPAQLRLATTGTAVRSSTSEYTAQRIALETFDLTVLGAALTGQGSVIMTKPDAAMGRPVGTFTFTLRGAVSLLDQLQQLETLPGMALMGARMGLGYFTRPGESDGELLSTIKIGPDGIITVNERQIYDLTDAAKAIGQ